MKEKKDCKECGVPLKDWQVKQGYDLCLGCYKSKKTTRRKTSHELLQDKSIEEEGEIEIKGEKELKEHKEQMQEEYLVEKNLGEDDSDKNQGEEEEE